MDVGRLELALNERLTPSRTEVVQAKRLISKAMAAGDIVTVPALQDLLPAAKDARPSNDLLVIEILTPRVPESAVVERHSQFRYVRLRVAGAEAIAELAAAGLIIAMDADLRASGPFTFRYRVHEGSQTRTGTVRTSIRTPALAGSYRLPHKLLGRQSWFLDADIFLDGISELDLSDQLRRILTEALAAFRYGMFLACASLLGAVSEGAWYAVAERVAGEKGALRKAVDGDRTAQVQKLLADEFRQLPAVGTTPDDLLAHAAVLRDIRNFGVHPRENPSEDLSGYLTEEACALLILNTHRYLQKLASTAARLDPEIRAGEDGVE